MKKILTLIITALTVASAHSQTVRAKQTLQITITGVPVAEQARLQGVYPVSSSGYIDMWKIGKVKAAGLTKSQLASSIAARFRSAQIYTSPVFQVLSQADGETQDKQMFTIGGQVRAAGQRQWTEGLTLYSAVQSAGGETAYGAVNRVKLYRNGKVYVYNLNIAKHKSVKIYAKDLIEVPQKNFIGK